MKPFSWKFPQYAEFNESDTLLLVSGGHFGKDDDTSGEIAVFSFDGIYNKRIFEILIILVKLLTVINFYR